MFLRVGFKSPFKMTQARMDLGAKYRLQRESFCSDPHRRSTFHQQHRNPREGFSKCYFASVELSHLISCKWSALTFKNVKKSQQIQRNDVTKKEAERRGKGPVQVEQSEEACKYGSLLHT